VVVYDIWEMTSSLQISYHQVTTAQSIAIHNKTTGKEGNNWLDRVIFS